MCKFGKYTVPKLNLEKYMDRFFLEKKITDRCLSYHVHEPIEVNIGTCTRSDRNEHARLDTTKYAVGKLKACRAKAPTWKSKSNQSRSLRDDADRRIQIDGSR